MGLSKHSIQLIQFIRPRFNKNSYGNSILWCWITFNSVIIMTINIPYLFNLAAILFIYLRTHRAQCNAQTSSIPSYFQERNC